MKSFLRVVVISVTVGFLTYIVGLFLPNEYQSSALIKPEVPDRERTASALGALATIGIQTEATSRIEDVELLLKSKDLTVRVVDRNNLWPMLIDGYDNAKRTIRPGIIGRIVGVAERPANEWDAIRAVRKLLSVKTDRRTGTISISFEGRRPENAAAALRFFLEEAKSRLQEEALARAKRNKEFIQDQILKTHDPLSKDRLYVLFGQEVEREMLAQNRDQFGFRILDGPRVPDRESGPPRLKFSIAAALAVLLGVVGFEIFRRNQGAA